MNWFRRKPISLGTAGERAAARFLRRRGYAILERNIKLGRYEIDIVARKGDTTAFVEVKTRKEGALAPPEENVHKKKQRHIRTAAHRYIDRDNDPKRYYRFDIAAVSMPEHGKPSITYYENAFPDQ